MKNIFLLIGILVVFGLIMMIMNSETTPQQNVTHDKKEDRVRCPPVYIDARTKPTNYDIRMYEESKRVVNKGFVNELMFKPKEKASNFHFESGITENNVSLNIGDDEVVDTSLPIGNIHVNYLLNKSSKL